MCTGQRNTWLGIVRLGNVHTRRTFIQQYQPKWIALTEDQGAEHTAASLSIVHTTVYATETLLEPAYSREPAYSSRGVVRPAICSQQVGR